MMNESWKKFKEIANDLESQDEPAIYEMNYWVNTREVQTDLEIGENCTKKGDLKEEEFIKKFKKKFKINHICGIVFTDGYKQTDKISTGIGLVIQGEEVGHRCSLLHLYGGTDGG